MYFGLAVTPETGDRTVTDFLFTMPRMLFGVSRILDLGGIFTQYNSSPTPEIADFQALLFQTVVAFGLRFVEAF